MGEKQLKFWMNWVNNSIRKVVSDDGGQDEIVEALINIECLLEEIVKTLTVGSKQS